MSRFCKFGKLHVSMFHVPHNYKKQSEVSFQGKYTTPTFKALKIRFRALENDTKKQEHF